MPVDSLYPYAAKGIIQHQFTGANVQIYITFKYPMNQDNKPAHAKWKCEVDSVAKNVTASVWQDEFTLKLTIGFIVTRPLQVTVEYDGPDANLTTTWDKQWEPWGAIVSDEIEPVITTRTFSTGPAQQDDVDVTNVNILFLDCSGNAITIGGFVGGIDGQVLHVAKTCAAANDVKLVHIAGGGDQDIYLHAGADETLTGEYGGWNLACDGSNWYDISHAKHV